MSINKIVFLRTLCWPQIRKSGDDSTIHFSTLLAYYQEIVAIIDYISLH